MENLSKSNGIGGTLKSVPEDFVVKEITGRGIILEPGKIYTSKDLGDEEVPEGKFTTMVLQKRDWNTIQALTSIAKLAGRGRKSIAYAGTKDRTSISVQLASIFGATPEQLTRIRLKDISINGAWKSNGVEMGSNIGNAFEISIRQIASTKIEPIIEELNGRFPNYFDRQRFGSRLNNATVGLCIMRNDFKEAAMHYLTDTENETNADAKEARKRLAEEMDFKSALSYFPRHLKGERSVISYMAMYDNYANALRKIPRGILIMFIHAVESMVFNNALEGRIRSKDFESEMHCAANFYGFPDISTVNATDGEFAAAPLIGYETKEQYISEYEKEAMETLEIKAQDFKIRGMPELSMKGSFRVMLAPIKEMKYSFNEKHSNAKIGFAIPSGSYATVLLNEITKAERFDIRSLSQ
ncbi:MAG: tRNA pseudouridine(13) synthase TruD [Candidatus Micrarchaeota archaeon]|nr:tRNA pseudouridine(13) synthase TruD [Candidatus Micrarchaeota archaeon]